MEKDICVECNKEIKGKIRFCDQCGRIMCNTCHSVTGQCIICCSEASREGKVKVVRKV